MKQLPSASTTCAHGNWARDECRGCLRARIAELEQDLATAERCHEVAEAERVALLHALKLACTVSGKLGYRTSGDVRMEMPTRVASVVRKALEGE